MFGLVVSQWPLRLDQILDGKDRSRLATRKYFFNQRVVNGWNSLAAEVVNAESVNSFKNAYDRSSPKDTHDRS